LACCGGGGGNDTILEVGEAEGREGGELEGAGESEADLADAPSLPYFLLGVPEADS
jgi:hypothetical protein